MFNLVITDSAKNYINSLIKDDEIFTIKIKESGCSGFQYIFSIENKKEINKENIIKSNNTDICIEKIYRNFLNNSKIDFTYDCFSKAIKIENPNIKNECGCGKSFSIKE